MSIKVCKRIVCDMCGGEYDEYADELHNMGQFNRASWDVNGSAPLDLCRACADKVQRFIRSGGGEGE